MLRVLWPLAAVIVIAEIVAPLRAYAQTPAEPGAIERTIPTETRRTPNVQVVGLPQRKSVEQSARLKTFTLGAVNIDGATVFSQQQLSSAFEAYLATEVDQAKLAQMAQAITARYRETGYLLSYAMVPQQDVDAGMVRLAVVEGRIDKVSVQGAGSSQAAIEAIAAPLLNGQPLRSASLERTMGLIRDFPGVTVGDIALMRSDADGGHYTLKISVVPDRLRAFTYADNRGTASIGHSRVYNSFSLSSVAIQGDELRFDVFAMPGGQSHYLYGQALAVLPIGRSGMKLQLSASRGDQYLRADERFNGQSENVMAQISYPFLRSRALTLLGKASLTDWRSVGKLAGARQLHDRLRVARLGVEVSNEGLTRFQGELLLSRGLGFDGMTRVGDPLASRPDASGRFTKFAATAQVSRQVSDRVTLRGTAMAQYSDHPLLSAEEFSLGGNRLGRAYRFNSRTGDSGAGAGIEVGYRLGKSDGRAVAELFGFADGGVAVDLRSSIAPNERRSLGSVGVGTRFAIGGVSASVEAGLPLNGGHHSPRLFASLFRAF